MSCSFVLWDAVKDAGVPGDGGQRCATGPDQLQCDHGSLLCWPAVAPDFGPLPQLGYSLKVQEKSGMISLKVTVVKLGTEANLARVV